MVEDIISHTCGDEDKKTSFLIFIFFSFSIQCKNGPLVVTVQKIIIIKK